jgi:hypothetical protein
MKVKRVKHKSKKKSFLDKIKNWDWKKIVTWIPRILAILYTVFITIFAFNESVIDLPWFVNIMPTIIFIVILALTWKKPLGAAITFLILGFGFTLVFKTYSNWLIFLIISLPLILMGILFLLEKLFVKKRDEQSIKKIKDRKEKLIKRK